MADFMAQVLFCDRLAVELVLDGNCDCVLQLRRDSGT